MSKAVANPPQMTTHVVNVHSPCVWRLTFYCPLVSTVTFSLALLLIGPTPAHLNTLDAVADANQVGLAAETEKLCSDSNHASVYPGHSL